MSSYGPVFDRVTVLEFVSRYVKLKPVGNGAIGLCPFHDDHSPSFWLNVNNGLWICFSCGLRGNLRSFLTRSGLSGTALDEAISPVQGLIETQQTLEKNKRRAKFLSDPFLGEVILKESLLGMYDYKPRMMVNAGFDPKLLRRLGVGYDHRLRRVTFPLRDLYGNLIGVSGRATVNGDVPRYKVYRGGYRDSSGQYVVGDFGENFDDEYPNFQVKSHRYLWNAHNAYPIILQDEKGWEPLVIVEGFKACLWLIQHGFPATVALMGASMSEDQRNLIARMSGNPIVLFLDNDDAGRKATLKEGKRLRPLVNELLVAEYPPGLEAPDDLDSIQIRRAIYMSEEWPKWLRTNS